MKVKLFGFKYIINILSILLLLFSSLFANLLSYSVSADTVSSGDNVTSSLTIDSNTLYIKQSDGEYAEVKDGDVLSLYKSVYTEIRWHFNNAESIKNGDYAEISLPTKYLSFYTFDDRELSLPDGTVIGKFKVFNGKLVIEFNENAGKYTSLQNGYIKLTGSTSSSKGKDDVIDGDLVFPQFSIPAGGTATEVIETPNYGELHKEGSQQDNKFRWAIRVNYDTIQNAMIGNPIDVKHDTVLVDHLENGQEVTSVTVANVIPVLSKNNVISGNYVTYEHNIFVELAQSSDESYDDFYNRVKLSPGSYGIYKSETGKQTLIVSYGDLPGSLSSSKTEEELIQTIEKSNSYTDLEKENTINGLKIYLKQLMVKCFYHR